MLKTFFSNFEDSSKLWVYAFCDPLNKKEKAIVETTLKDFTQHWMSHETKTKGSYQIIYDQFALLVNEEKMISGCSIDSSVRIFKDLESTYHLKALDKSLIFYQDKKNKIDHFNRFDINLLIRKKIISSNTIIFDNSISTLKQLRLGKWEVEAKKTWLQKFF